MRSREPGLLVAAGRPRQSYVRPGVLQPSQSSADPFMQQARDTENIAPTPTISKATGAGGANSECRSARRGSPHTLRGNRGPLREERQGRDRSWQYRPSRFEGNS